MATRQFRFAIQGGPFNDPHALSTHARLVESLGYDELFSSDHIGVFDSSGSSDRVDPLLPLLAAAAATTTLRVGPLVLNNEFYVPSLLARSAITIDQLTEGRLVLGLGTGYAEAEHDAIGHPIRPPRSRVSRFEESVTIIRALLDSGSVDLDGEHESAHFDDIGARPVQPKVPLLIGGDGRRMIGIGGRFADVFQFTGLGTDPDTGGLDTAGFAVESVAERAGWLDESAGDRDVERSLLVQFTAVDDGVPPVGELATRFGLDADVVEHTPFSLSGSLDRVVDKLEHLRERLGVSHVVVRDPEGFAPVVAALAGR